MFPLTARRDVTQGRIAPGCHLGSYEIQPPHTSPSESDSNISLMESTAETIHEFPDSPSCPGGLYELPEYSVLSGGYEGTEELPFNKTGKLQANT